MPFRHCIDVVGFLCVSHAVLTTFAVEVRLVRQEPDATAVSADTPQLPVIATTFKNTAGIALHPSGNYALVADTGNNQIHNLNIFTGAVTLQAGSGSHGTVDGTSIASSFRRPTGIAIAEDSIVVADEGNNKIRKIDIATGAVSTLAGDGSAGCLDAAGMQASFRKPSGVAIGPSGTFALIVDKGNNKIRRVDIATGEVSTFAGNGTAGFSDGPGANATFNEPHGIALAGDGSRAWITDTGNRAVREINMSTGEVRRLLGVKADENSSLTFGKPTGISVSPDSTFALIADKGNRVIHEVDLSTGEVTTLAGSGTLGVVDAFGIAASFTDPVDVAIDVEGEYALVADGRSHEIRKIHLFTGEVLTLSGGTQGSAALATLPAPRHVTTTPGGDLHCVEPHC